MKITTPLCLVTFFFSVLVGGSASAQALKGKILDPEGNPLEFASVVLSPEVDGGLLSSEHAVQTDSAGLYQLNGLRPMGYQLLIDYVGYEPIKMVYRQGVNDTVINLKFKGDGLILSEVVVSGARPVIERKIDRTVFNVSSSIAALGGDGLDALKKAPGVKVTDNGLSLIGKNSVNVLVNDRVVEMSGEDLMSYLKGLSADDIDRIEVITNPPAKYEAKGNSGLINIVMKQSKVMGYTGSLRTSYTQRTKSGGSGGGSLYYNERKFRVNASLNTSRGELINRTNYINTYPTVIQTEDGGFSNSQKGALSGSLGVDYQLSKSTVLGIAYSGGGGRFGFDTDAETKQSDHDLNLGSYSISTNKSNIKANRNGVNLHLLQALDSTGKKLSVDLDWFSFSKSMDAKFDNLFLFGSSPGDNTQTAGGQDIKVYTAKVDLELPFKPVTLSVGTKFSLVKNESNSQLDKLIGKVYVNDPLRSSQFDYTESNQAVYLNANKTLGNWSVQAGLRGELTQTEGVSLTVNQRSDTSYFKVFPTLFVNYVIDSKHTLGLTYGKRVDRPAYFSLDPFRGQLTETSYFMGNPYLQPAYFDNFELSHSYNSFLTTVLSYTRGNNLFSEVVLIEDGKRGVLWENYMTNTQYQLSNTVVVKPFNWLESTNQVFVNYNQASSFVAEISVPNNNYWGGRLSTQNQVAFNAAKTIAGSIDVSYDLPGTDGAYTTAAYTSIDVGMKFVLMDKKVVLGLNGLNLLGQRQKLVAFSNGQQSALSFYNDSRQFRLSLNYKFGNDKLKQQQRSGGNQDEQNRIN